LVVEPSTATAIAGTSVNLKVSTVTTGGYTGLTTLSTGTLPTGVTGTFTPPTLGPNTSGLLTLTTSGSTPSSASIEVRGIATIEGAAVTRTGTTLLNVQGAGQTVLAGQVRDEHDKPLAGVTIKLGGAVPTTLGTTDAAGNFLVNLSVAGSQVFLIDGSTANTPTVSYASIPVTVTIQAGVVNTLGFTVYLHAQPVTQPLPVAPAVATPITFATLPDFQVTIPAGVQIIGWDGQPNTQIGVRAVPLDRLAVPPIPAGVETDTVYMFSFGKVGGGTPTQPIPVTFPNTIGAYPGQQVELWYYNEAPDGTAPNQWEMFGLGTVSNDGKLIVSNPGVGIPRFCCGAGFPRRPLPPPNNPPPENAPEPSPEECPVCGGPIDLASGIVWYTATDLTLRGRIPIAVTRHYRTLDPTIGPFGVGGRHSYEVFVRAVTSDLVLMLTPRNLRPRFLRQADGTFVNTDLPAYRGAVLTRNPDGTTTLRYKDGTVWTFSSTGWLIRQADRNGNTIFVQRDSQNRVTSVVEPGGRELTFSYSGSDLTVQQVTDPLGRTVRYTYDGSNRLTQVTNPLGGTWQYTYDAGGRLASITDPRGIVVEQNTYDSSGRAIQQGLADGGTFQIGYQVVAGTVTGVTVTNPNGSHTSYRLGPGRVLTETTDSLGQRIQAPRASGSKLITSRIDALGRETGYTYDGTGSVTAVTDALGNVQAFTYEPTFNQILTSTDALNQTTSFTYDAKGNLIGITDPLNQGITFGYNARGDRTSVTDPLNHTTNLEYDSVGNLTATTDPLGNRTERTYDAVSRLIVLKDPKGAVTRFSYDALDRPVSITDPLSGTTTFTYDPVGNLLTVSDAKGQTTTHTYDVMNRLATRTDALNRTESYTYDLNGNLKTVTDRKGQVTTHSYDAQNRRTRTDFADGSFITYAYDPAGNLVGITDSQTGTMIRTYDALNRLTSEVTPQGAITYVYNQVNRRTQMQVNGLPPVSYQYDGNSRLTQIHQGSQMVTVDYNAANRRRILTLPNGITVTHIYDESSRLIAQTYTGPSGVLGDLTYTYDAAGNRIATGGSWARTGLPDPVTPTDYDGADQQLGFGPSTQTFDANGNLLTQTDASGTTTYTWDARNRLIGINAPTLTASFTYDALGRRISKTINGDATTFHYDGLDAVRETGAAGEVAYLRTLAIDEILTRTDASGTQVYLTDILASTVALTDNNGSLGTEYTYEPFGQTAVSGVPTSNAFQFTGRENDGTGLHYYRARYYDAGKGRFSAPDPLGMGEGGTNLYVYAGNRPTLDVDPLGLLECIRQGCTYSPLQELSRKPMGDWKFFGSMTVGPGVTNTPRPGYTILCRWKRTIQITYGYKVTCTFACTDPCRAPYTYEESSDLPSSVREEVEDKTTVNFQTLWSGWGGSKEAADIFCVGFGKPRSSP
jgi:RHS repeat-associated protein